MLIKVRFTQDGYSVDLDVDVEESLEGVKDVLDKLDRLCATRSAPRNPKALLATGPKAGLIVDWIRAQEAPRAVNYINSRCPVPGTARILKALIDQNLVELHPSTYENKAGKVKGMTGVFLPGTYNPEEEAAEDVKGITYSFLLDNPYSAVKEVVLGTGLSPKRVGAALEVLVSEDKVREDEEDPGKFYVYE